MHTLLATKAAVSELVACVVMTNNCSGSWFVLRSLTQLLSVGFCIQLKSCKYLTSVLTSTICNFDDNFRLQLV